MIVLVPPRDGGTHLIADGMYIIVTQMVNSIICKFTGFFVFARGTTAI